jgi:hypothetical protein
MLAINYIARAIFTFIFVGALAVFVKIDSDISGDGFAIGVFGSLVAMAYAWLIDVNKFKVGYNHLVLQAASWVSGYLAFFVVYPFVVDFAEMAGEYRYIPTFVLIVATMIVFNKHIAAAEKRGQATE